ncbi:signal peptidase I [Nocardioides lijunqiniae]|uniref:signal peptidase I n=1 Tax=Nocardioides lijunqiniae TaxID=2760832 RepID=UPI0018780332
MPEADAPEEPAKRKLPLWLETVVLLTVAVVLALVIKTLFVQAFYIPSASMKPGLVENDRILVQKVSYWFGGSPSRGDVVVFEDPGGWLDGLAPEPTSPLVKGLTKIGLYPSGGHLVKRVIGVEGDTIVCCDEEGRLEVNGVALDEDEFIKPQKCDGPMPGPACDWTAGPVPDGEMFVMGDNRNESADSSARLCVNRGPKCDDSLAFVPVDLVVGKVFALVWPPGRAHFVGRPDVFEDVPAG